MGHNPILLIPQACQVEGHACLVFCHESIDLISRLLQIIKHVKPRVSASEQYSNWSPYSLSDQLGRFDSDTGIFPWSSYRALPHFFLRPKIDLVIDDYRKEQWKHNIPLFQYNPKGEARRPRGNIRQITIVVFNHGGYPLEKATVHVHVVKKKRPLHRRLGTLVGMRLWDFPPDVKVAWDAEPDEVVYKSVQDDLNENDVAKQIRNKILSDYTTTIDARYEKIAVVAFAVEGHANAYLSDAKTTPLLVGHDYNLLVSVSGRKMPSTRPRLYRLGLKDWDHLSLTRRPRF